MSKNRNKTGIYIRNNIIYVQGSVDYIFYRKSTGKKATKANIAWVKKNAYDVLLNIIDKTEDNNLNYALKEYGYKSFEINAPNRRESTTKEYIATYKRHILPYFGKWNLKDIKPSDLKMWQVKLLKNRTGVTVNDIRSVFRGILQDAFYDELIDRNPFDLVRRPKKEKTKINPFSLEDVQLLIENADGWFKHYIITAFFTGVRTGEMLGLQWSDIDFDNNIIYIQRSIRKGLITAPKTENSIREIDMLPVVKNALLEQKEITGNNPYVFVNQYGNFYSSSEKIIRYKWKPLIKKCDLEYRILYHTRHSFASIMLQQAEEIAWVSQMMGHSDIHTTLTKYTRFIPRKNKKRATFLDEFGLKAS